MLPISGSELPSSPEALSNELRQGFLRYGVAATSVSADGDDVRTLRTLAVDLTGSNVDRSAQPPRSISLGQDSITAADFRMEGSPVLLEGVPANFSVTGQDVRLALGEGDGYKFLVPQSVRTGLVRIEVMREALEALIQKVGSEAAGKQGVEIKETHVTLTSKSDRAISFQAEVVGKVFLMKAPVTLTGDVAIDEQLRLHFSNLAVGGSGMIANLANGFAQPYLKRAQAEPIPLAVVNLGSMKVQDIRLRGGESLQIEAQLAG